MIAWNGGLIIASYGFGLNENMYIVFGKKKNI